MVLKIISLSIAIFCLFSGCSSINTVNSGKLSFKISYPDFDKENNQLTYMFLPKEQTVYFDEELMCSEIKKAMVEINFFTNNEDETLVTDFMFNTRSYAELKPEDKPLLAKMNQGYSLNKTVIRETELAGFKCKVITVTLPDGKKTELYYTDEIEIKNGNWFSPYKDLNETLLKYTVIQNGMKMEFTLKDYAKLLDEEKKKLKPSKPETEVSYLVFQEKIKEMFDQFLN